MSKIDEKMLQMVVEMATSGGRMEAQQEAKDAEIIRLKQELEERDRRIASLEARLRQLEGQQPRVVVNQYFVLSMMKTMDYVSNLGNHERCFVGHFMHQTMPDDTPPSIIAQVDEMTRLQQQEAKVTVQNNYGPVNGNIAEQHLELPAIDDTTKQLDDHE